MGKIITWSLNNILLKPKQTNKKTPQKPHYESMKNQKGNKKIPGDK